ncbi:MAG: HupE/UreJ family protein [Methylococcales bacterium]
MNKSALLKVLGLVSLFPGVAIAHIGVVETTGFIHGFSHPIGGADHLIVMLAVGLWAAQIGRRALWAVPGTFVMVMVLGGVLGFSGVSVPFIEVGILLSVLVLGVLIAGAFKLPVILSALIVGFFALFHGYAHGTEMPVAIGAASYSIGFTLATTMLHTIGIAVGILSRGIHLEKANRFAGGILVLYGIYLAAS